MGALKDTSLNFGMQNFLWVKEDTSDGTYDYNLFLSKKGSILILRTNKAGTEARYWIGTGDFATIDAAKGGFTYQYPNQLKDQSI
jgi:hypothetical protein